MKRQILLNVYDVKSRCFNLLVETGLMLKSIYTLNVNQIKIKSEVEND